MENVIVGFHAPGSLTIEVEDTDDTDAMVEAFVEEVKGLSDEELVENLTTDHDWLAENLAYIDTTDGEVLEEW